MLDFQAEFQTETLPVVAEARFFPGIVLYLTYWFRQREQARMISLFMAAVPISNMLGAPVSGFILDHVHWLGISSWRWLLILEGLPAVACVSPSSSSHQSNLQFRAEAFNVLNRANLGIPNLVMLTASGTPASSAGAITTTASTSRQIQLGLKLSW